MLSLLGLNISGEAKFRTRVPGVSRWGTLCGVLGMLMFITGCPVVTPCTTDEECADDAVFCNGLEFCNVEASTCAHAGDPCEADQTCDEDADVCLTACTSDDVCDDLDVCTDDTCGDDDVCVFTNNTAACDDADACTEDEACADGLCAGGTAVDCDDLDLCTEDSCDSAAGCVYEDVVCDDVIACTTDTCDSVTGDCVNADNCPAGQECDLVTGLCVGVACTTATEAVDCNDDDPCTTDVCVDNLCQNTPVTCDDSVTCTDDSCDAITGDCLNVDNCTAPETCDEAADACVAPTTGVTVDAGVDQSVNGGATVSLVCTQTDAGDTADSLIWSETGGTTLTLTGNDGDGLAGFTAPITGTFTLVCTGTLGTETGTDEMTVTIGEGGVVIFEDKVFQLNNDEFTGGGALTSGTVAAGTVTQPGGASAVATIPGVQATDILLSFSCFSGPGGVDDCTGVVFNPGTVINGGTAVGVYTLPVVTGPHTVLRGSARTTTVTSWANPGDWTFEVIATGGGQQVSAQAVYTINSGFDIFARAADTNLYTSTAGTPTFNNGETTDDFPPVTLNDVVANGMAGVVLAQGQVTNHVVAPGGSFTADFMVLARTAGTLTFSHRDISGTSMGTFVTQESFEITPADPIATETITPTFTATDTAAANLAPATYAVYAEWDSSVGSQDDTALLPTDLMFHVQPSITDLDSTTITVNDAGDTTTGLLAINSQTGKTVKMHGGQAEGVANADNVDDLCGDLIAECDVNNDGIMELVVIDSQAGAGSEEISLIWTTADPELDMADNLAFNRGIVIPGTVPQVTDLDVQTLGTTATGAIADLHIATAVACGDINNDGFTDLAIGWGGADAASDDTGADGEVCLFYHLGDTTGISTDDRTDFTDDPWDEDGRTSTVTTNGVCIERTEDGAVVELGWNFGYSLLFTNFMGGDGDELIIGAPHENAVGNDSDTGNEHGTAYVISTSSADLNNLTAIVIVLPGTPGANQIDVVIEPDTTTLNACGAALAAIDWDSGTAGFMDIVLGCPGHTTDAGAVYVFNGTASPTTTLTDGFAGTEIRGEADDGIGRRIVVCDFDGDGKDDIITSGASSDTYGATSTGIIYVFTDAVDGVGDTDATLTTNTGIFEYSGSTTDNVGWRMGCGDINGDGYDDLAFTAQGYQGGTLNDEVRVLTGSATEPTTSVMTVDLVLDNIDMDQPTEDFAMQDVTAIATDDIAALDHCISAPFDFLGVIDINGDGVKDVVAVEQGAGTNSQGLAHWLCGRE